MTYRLKQFWQGVRAKLSSSDLDFVRENLSEAERALFFQMAVYDQHHCIIVARTACELGALFGVGPEGLGILPRAALLHDIGKVRGDVGLVDRGLIVMISKFPRLFERCAAIGESRSRGFFRACRIIRDHARRGAHMAETFGVSPVICELIRRHHDDNPGRDLLLKAIQEADNKA